MVFNNQFCRNVQISIYSRMCVVYPMHNLFLSTTHLMVELWKTRTFILKQIMMMTIRIESKAMCVLQFIGGASIFYPHFLDLLQNNGKYGHVIFSFCFKRFLTRGAL